MLPLTTHWVKHVPTPPMSIPHDTAYDHKWLESGDLVIAPPSAPTALDDGPFWSLTLTPDFFLLRAPQVFELLSLFSASFHSSLSASLCVCPGQGGAVASSFLFFKSSFRTDTVPCTQHQQRQKLQSPMFAHCVEVSEALSYPFCDLTPRQSCDNGVIIILLLQTGNLCPGSSLLRYSDAKCQHSATVPYDLINLCWIDFMLLGWWCRYGWGDKK